MAPSSSKPITTENEQSISLIENESFTLAPILGFNFEVVGNTYETEFHIVYLNQLELIGSSTDEDSEAELNWVLEEFKKRKLEHVGDGAAATEKCVSLKARLNKEEKAATFFFEVEETFLQYLKGLTSCLPFRFEVKGEITNQKELLSVNPPANEKEEEYKPFSFKDALPSDRRGELFCQKEGHKSQLGRNIYMIATTANPTLVPKLKFSWSVIVSWLSELEQPLRVQLGSLASNLYLSDQTKDLTIVARDGSQMKCHKLVFASYNPDLAALLLSPPPNKTELQVDSSGMQIEMKDLSGDGLTYLINYFYEKSISLKDVRSAVAVELLQASHKYGLSQLECRFYKLLLKKDTYWFTADSIVDLYYFVKKLEKFKSLEKHCLKVMTRMHNQIRTCERFQQLEDKEVVELLWLLFEYK